ncbi:uncharacterized protein LOC132759939 [Ruditapes philippinarum]|uniref:uncharacterized protein LOC132759939 n=1 Tax=Ruditapes philippinarum TaxID=129788 RepID=UPI00295B89A6|nr:uncharacterized protein LOC132759939 [Ruditapes philippinarum]
MIMMVFKNTTVFILLLALFVLAAECRKGGGGSGGGRSRGRIITGGGGNRSTRSSSSGSIGYWWILPVAIVCPILVALIVYLCYKYEACKKGTSATEQSQRMTSLQRIGGNVPKQFPTQRSGNSSDRRHRPQENVSLSMISGAHQVQDRKTFPSYPLHTVVQLPSSFKQTKIPYQQRSAKHNAAFML